MVSKSKAGINRNRSNLIIGLTGPFGSGCSTMRDVLVARFGFHSFKIADDIRTEVEALNQTIPKGKKGWRSRLQEHGDARRKGRIGYWVEKVAGRIDKSKVGDKGIVIDGLQ